MRAYRFNPGGDYWIETTRLQHHARPAMRARVGMLSQIARDRLALSTRGRALRVRRVDAALLPHCRARCSACLASLWCLLLLVYPYATLAAGLLHYAVNAFLCTRPAGRA